MSEEKSFIKFAKVRPTAKIPTKEICNAGYDIYADFEEDYVIIPTNKTVLVPTGIASALSSDLYLQVQERGSTGSRGLKYSAGVIDSSYRGEIFIAITNCSRDSYAIAKEGAIFPDNEDTVDLKIYPYKKAIAQLVVHKVYNEVPVEEISIDELEAIPSARGSGKLGSSGK